MPERILLLALRGRDAPVLHALLAREDRICDVCTSVDDLAAALAAGADVAVLTEESLSGNRDGLTEWLSEQPAWSDFPFVLLATKRTGRRSPEDLGMLDTLGNVVLLERPVHGETLVSAINSALRGRRRQYEARRLLDDLTSAEDRLMQLNQDLEARILLRTSELSEANNRLTEEVAERERAQAALVQAQKMEAVGHLTGGIAHDFNNLLTVIAGNLEIIQRRTEDSRTEKLAGYAQQAADRAAKLTHQLLAFSRTQRLDLHPVDLNRLVGEMSDLLTRTLGPGIAIRMDMDPGSPWAVADPNQLELAILNLAINARDAMAEAGTLTISTALRGGDGPPLASGDYGIVTVEDTGTGIPAAIQQKIFDPFFTTKPVGKGTGLGLSQVFGIAQQSGGTVRIESTEGQGSRMAIWLPRAAPLAGSATLSTTPDLPSPKADAHVLVIDDDVGVRRFIADSLEAAGYHLTAVGSGPEGLAALATGQHDLLIVDYAMPGMNGVDVVKEARRLHADLPIIMATGYADMGAVQTVLDPSRILNKPFRIDDLTAAVQEALSTAH